MWVSIYLLLTQGKFCRLAGIKRWNAFKNLFKTHRVSGMQLISYQPHMREGMLLKLFHDKIMNYHRGCDWKRAWLIVLANAEREFILCSLDDLTFWPLKFHPFRKQLIFDAYDPLREYLPGREFLTKINYKFGKRFIFRDARFKDELRRVGNTKAEVCYVPDSPQFAVMRNYRDKFKNFEKIKFISSGWVTSHGDGGIIESLYLINRLWPNNEIHVCMTQFMQLNDERFEVLYEFMRVRSNCFLYHNLNQMDYGNLLARCHVGINLHDPLVRGNPYKEFKLDMVKKSPSMRALDYASGGLILMTNPQMRYAIRQFKKYSPHKKTIYLSTKTKPEELTNLMQAVANA